MIVRIALLESSCGLPGSQPLLFVVLHRATICNSQFAILNLQWSICNVCFSESTKLPTKEDARSWMIKQPSTSTVGLNRRPKRPRIALRRQLRRTPEQGHRGCRRETTPRMSELEHAMLLRLYRRPRRAKFHPVPLTPSVDRQISKCWPMRGLDARRTIAVRALMRDSPPGWNPLA